MFKVRVKVMGFQGDTQKYPCHFNYKIGDEIIWNGATFVGRICPAILEMLTPKVIALYKAGPRYRETGYYLPFWYAPVSEYDPSYKKYDGIGFKPVLKTIEEPKYHMAHLRPPNTYLWPPHSEQTVMKGVGITCPDLRTAVMFKLEAFDLADDGDCVTYFRRMMGILSKVTKKQGVSVDKLLSLYSKEEIENIYPSLSPVMMQMLVEELTLMSYLEIKDSKAYITKKGEEKLKVFIQGLPTEDREVLKL
jgi:uncharacterized repeat protein (TIGR04076 family)